MKNMDCANMIKRLQADDKTAFDWLYNQFSRKIYLNALKLTKNSAAAEDIVQEVFIVLWEKRSTIDPGRPLLNWIFVISYHKAVDYLKAVLKTTLIPESSLCDMHYPAKAEAFRRERQLTLLEHAVGRLSPQQRRVVNLCKLQGRTYEYAARELSISKHTVKEHLSAAMKNIRSFVDDSKCYD